MKYLVITVACLVSVAGCGKSDTDYNSGLNDRNRVGATPRNTDTDFPERDANNTGMNKRDRDGTLPTPVDQTSSEGDLEKLTAIRKRLMDSELSTDAKNVKVISENGRVTLRGPVRSFEEKDTVARIAREIAGTTNVDDLIDVIAAK